MSTTHSAPSPKFHFGILLALFLSSLSSHAFASTRYVNASATGAVHDGLSWDTAATTVQAGVDAASAGDDVWVAKGVYTGSANIFKNVNLYGGFAGTETGLTQRDWKLNPTILDAGGGAANIATNLATTSVIDGFTIRNTNRLTGTGVTLAGTSVKLYNCTLLHHGTAVSAGGTACTVANCIIADSAVGVSSDGGSPVIDGNVITGCGSAIASGVGSATAYNNTIVNNGTGVEYANYLRGNIIAWNGTGVSSFNTVTASLPANNCLYGNDSDWGSNTSQTGLNGNIAVDPKLANPAVGNVRLQTGSPCINAGYSVTLPLTVDVYGQTRVQGAKIDIGAAEYGSAPPTINPMTIRISPTGDDANDGQSWASAKKSLQSAVDSMFGIGGEIWVKRGVYSDPVSIFYTLSVRGGFYGDESVLAARQGSAFTLCVDPRSVAISVMARVSPATIDEGSIRGGYAGIECDGGSTVVSNCTVGGCADGIAVYAGAPAIVNDTLAANARGIYCLDGTPAVTNTILSACATGVYLDPDGIGAPALSHCCVFGNGVNFSGIADPTGANGNISADPLLASTVYGDLHIQPGSPCVGAGYPGVTPAPGDRDVDGESRFHLGLIDIGADQSNGIQRTVTPRVVWVDGAIGSDANDGSTHDLAMKTVQAAENAASPVGGEVWVCAGTYASNIEMRPFAYLYGGFSGAEYARANRDVKANLTTLAGEAANPTVSFDGGNGCAGVDGFTVTNGTVAIVCNSASPTIAHDTLPNSTVGLQTTDSSPVVEFCTVSGNSWGFYLDGGSATIRNNTVTGNSTAGIACWNGTTSIRDNSILGNGSSGLYLVGGASSVVGNTVMGGDTGLSVSGGTLVTLANDIVAYNLTGLVVGATPTQASVRYCDLFHNNTVSVGIANPTGSSGNVAVDPIFASPTYGDVHLQPSSTLIGAGDPTAVQAGDVDMDSAARLTAGLVDIGADEADGVERTVNPLVVRVNSSGGADANDGTSWARAKQTLQAGIDAASSVGGEVWVAGGTYTEQIRLKPFVYVYGGFNASEYDRTSHPPVLGATVLDGTGIPTKIKVRGGYTFVGLDGVTVTNSALGISAFGSAASITRCQFLANTTALSDTGGALTLSRNAFTSNGGATAFAITSTGATSSITDNVFTNNGTGTSLTSGAISIDSGAQVVAGNLIVGSETAVYSTGSGTIVNNTINVRRYGLYVYGPSGTPAYSDLFANNVVTGTGTGIYRTGTAITVSLRNNDVYGCPTLYSGITNPTGTNGNISADPKFRFTGVYRVAAGSPVIDTGDDASAIVGLADLDGKTRPQGAHVDIGAYEYTASTLTVANATRALRVAGGFAPAVMGDVVTLDVTNDGRVTLVDAVRVLRNAVGMDE